MRISGPLTKMASAHQNPVKYYLTIGDDFLLANDLIGKELKLEWQHQIECHCGKIVAQTYRMNFCRECFFTKPQAADFIFHPELSKAHTGEAERDLAWEEKFQLQPHILYLANSAGLKVGVTRRAQMPTRWIDQGASEALPIAEVPNRYLAGIAEVALKHHVNDKTPWRAMLTNTMIDVDLKAERDKLISLLPEEVKPYAIADGESITFEYPVEEYPKKVNSINFQKAQSLEGKLIGIRGQYLIFANNLVFNIRSHEGYIVELDF